MACGGFHTLILTSENEVYAFGAGNYGECGYGEFLDTSKPKLVRFGTQGHNETSNFGGTEKTLDFGTQPLIADIAAGGRHSLVLTDEGNVFAFGYGTNGQLGLKST